MLAIVAAPAAAQDARETMQRLMTLVLAAESCALTIPDGPRQALAAEGARLQALARIPVSEMDWMMSRPTGEPPSGFCDTLRGSLDRLVQDATEDAGRVR